jgi:hypothetical protein
VRGKRYWGAEMLIKNRLKQTHRRGPLAVIVIDKML